jgi:hypothetical protein
MTDVFSTFDIIKALGIERERLREWMNRSYLRPSVMSSGQGIKSEFTRCDVYAVELFRQLLEGGFDRDHAGVFVRFFQDQMKNESNFPSYLIIRLGSLRTATGVDVDEEYCASFAVDNEKINLDEGCLDRPTDMKFNRQWKMLHVVNLKTLRNHTDEALRKL